MKRLTLMRHADARWQDPSLPDLQRPLSRRGSAAAETMARRLLELELVPDLLLVSPARRTQQTAEIVARGLSVPERRVLRDEALYLASAADLLKVVERTGPRVAHILLVGHNPGVSELMQRLAPRSAGGGGGGGGGGSSGLATAAVCSIAFDCAHWNRIAGAAVTDVQRAAPPKRLFGLFG